MKNTTSHTGIITIVIAVIVASVAYLALRPSSTPVDSSGLVADTANADVGLAEVSLLNQIQNIPMDVSLFDASNRVYHSLIDHTAEIPDQPVGRPNPFAPIPGVSNPSTPVATTPTR
jgi:hypothetical protein